MELNNARTQMVLINLQIEIDVANRLGSSELQSQIETLVVLFIR